MGALRTAIGAVALLTASWGCASSSPVAADTDTAPVDTGSATEEEQRSRLARAASGVRSTFELESFSRSEDQVIADPFEALNRRIYSFNTVADSYVLEPTADAYRYLLPFQARESVRAFIDNLKSPLWFTNDLLQGEWARAGITARRFALNTTLGVGGVYDFAANVADIPKHDEDFGQTLAVWGVDHGPYIMLPVLGPSTTRDTIGRLGDYAIDPFTWAEFSGETAFFWGRNIADTIDIRERVDQAVELTRRSADPYSQVRATYVQSRLRAIRNGQTDIDNLPDFDFDLDLE